MSRILTAGGLVLVAATLTHGQTITVMQEDFESGLGAWTAKVFGADKPNNNAPLVFTATDPLLYTNADNPGSQSVGYSSNMSPWDGQQPQYLRHLLPAAVAPGTYDVTLEVDSYIYYGDTAGDKWGVGNQVFVLTNAKYNNVNWDPQSGEDADFMRKSRWPGWVNNTEDWTLNGHWQHLTFTKTLATTTGNFEIRLLMYEKYAGAQALAWDNVQLTVKQAGTTVFKYPNSAPDGFDSGLGDWQAMVGVGNNDSPTTFTSTDAQLYTNTNNPGSTSAGYSSNLTNPDLSAGQWIQRQFPGRLAPGTYTVTLEMDLYCYKDPAEGDPWGLGNRVYVLTDDQYNDPSWNFDSNPPIGFGFALAYWSGDANWTLNGKWQHVLVQQEMTTATGNLEIRLLLHDKHPRAQAVAWDNVRLSIGLPCFDPRFDSDGDKDVDQDDFGVFQACFTGAEATSIDNPNVCRCVNSDGGTDIDAMDLNAFFACASTSGPAIPALASCDDALSPP